MLCSLSCAVTDRSPGDCEHFAWNGCHWCHLHHGPIASGCNSASIWSSLQRQQLLLHSHTLSSHHPVVFIMKIFQEATSNIPRSPSVFKVILLLPLIWGNLSLPVATCVCPHICGSFWQRPPTMSPPFFSQRDIFLPSIIAYHCYSTCARALLPEDTVWKGWLILTQPTVTNFRAQSDNTTHLM